MLWLFKVTNNGFLPAIFKNWPIKISFTPPLCIEVHVQIQESEQSSSHVLGVSISPDSTIFFSLDFETVPTVWYSVFSFPSHYTGKSIFWLWACSRMPFVNLATSTSFYCSKNCLFVVFFFFFFIVQIYIREYRRDKYVSSRVSSHYPFCM